ncbi:hypothetical protein SUGI_0596540 [Cryptomeria japonica]|nr:hypothetical protein SUGI_0596540 [Cryptomeria japonica]
MVSFISCLLMRLLLLFLRLLKILLSPLGVNPPPKVPPSGANPSSLASADNVVLDSAVDSSHRMFVPSPVAQPSAIGPKQALISSFFAYSGDSAPMASCVAPSTPLPLSASLSSVLGSPLEPASCQNVFEDTETGSSRGGCLNFYILKEI